MKLKNHARLLVGKLRKAPHFLCPLCNYEGQFVPTTNRDMGKRLHSSCPKCGSKERHRLMFHALTTHLKAHINVDAHILHFSAEPHITNLLREKVGRYVTAKFRGKADQTLDIRNIALPDNSFDMVIATHVLEHIDNDMAAMSEIRRILRPNGIALLAVPVYASQTIEYNQPMESGGHVRAPGLDYFDRMRSVFDEVTVIESRDAPIEYQTFCLENRSHWPTAKAPFTKPLKGLSFSEYLPVCQKQETLDLASC